MRAGKLVRGIPGLVPRTVPVHRDGMNRDIARRIAAARHIVTSQAVRLHRGFGRARSAWKSDGTRVTTTDLAISSTVITRLRKAFPGDQVFSEEQLEARPPPVTARFCWVLDPIDGTNNFAAGIPFCAISLALLERGRPVYGVVYDLARRTLIHGGPGFGAFDGRKPARVQTKPAHAQSLIGFHSPIEPGSAPDPTTLIRRFKIRGLGSSTLHLAYVGIGLLDGVVDHNVRVWDIAAAHAIALGGGAEVRYLRHGPFPLKRFSLDMPRIHYVAGNRAVCQELRKLTAK